MNPPLSLGVIADDFTGAMDTGAQFARCGLQTRLVLNMDSATTSTSPVVIINTASREISPSEAQARLQVAASRLHGRQLFKKIDSTLRGHIAAELNGLLEAFPGAKIVLCPTAPRQGRIVKDGRLYVNGQPLDHSAFRDDPAFPARTALVAERIGAAAAYLPLSIVRSTVSELADAITAAPHVLVITDAVDEEDLLRISQAAIQVDAIPCGAFGLASAWAQALAGGQPASAPFVFPIADEPVLLVAGSANPRSHAQIAALRSHANSRIYPIMVPLTADEEDQLLDELNGEWNNARAIVLCPGLQEIHPSTEWLSFAGAISQLAARLIRRQRPSGLIITGGETANALCDGLGVQAVELLGEAAPGIPVGRLVGGSTDGLTLVSKAGGFGQDDCLEKLIYP